MEFREVVALGYIIYTVCYLGEWVLDRAWNGSYINTRSVVISQFHYRLYVFCTACFIFELLLHHI